MTTKLEQAARELLDAMKCKSLRVITQKETALREALAEPELNLNCKSVQKRLATSWGYVKAEQAEQKPVAYCCGFENTHPDGWIDCKIFRDGEFTTPLYAAPVRTKDLTDDEIFKLFYSDGKEPIDHYEFARAVIAADRKLNGVEK